MVQVPTQRGAPSQGAASSPQGGADLRLGLPVSVVDGFLAAVGVEWLQVAWS